MKNKELFCNSIMQEELGMDIQVKRPEDWKEDYKDFVEATRKFYAKELDVKSYKGTRGFPEASAAMRRRAQRQACFV